MIATNPEECRVVVGPAPSLLSKKVFLEGVCVRMAEARADGARARPHPLAPSRTARALDVREDGSGSLDFDEPVRAAAPGQSAVFYDPARPEVILGGGVIARPAA